jgi:hypothetical protein
MFDDAAFDTSAFDENAFNFTEDSAGGSTSAYGFCSFNFFFPRF